MQTLNHPWPYLYRQTVPWKVCRSTINHLRREHGWIRFGPTGKRKEISLFANQTGMHDMRYGARNNSIQIESDLAMVVWLEEASKTWSNQPSTAVNSFMLILKIKNAIKTLCKAKYWDDTKQFFLKNATLIHKSASSRPFSVVWNEQKDIKKNK